MKKLISGMILTLFLFFCSIVYAADFSGTWEGNIGDYGIYRLKLKQSNNKVLGRIKNYENSLIDTLFFRGSKKGETLEFTLKGISDSCPKTFKGKARLQFKSSQMRIKCSLSDCDTEGDTLEGILTRID